MSQLKYFDESTGQWLPAIVGARGEAGPGVPSGGSAYKVLSKIDGTDYNTAWMDKEVQNIGLINNAQENVAHDCSLSYIFKHSSIQDNFTAKLNNISLMENKKVDVVLLLEQGSIPYIPFMVKINGNDANIKWRDGVIPSGHANKTDKVTFSIVCTSAIVPEQYEVYGELSNYSLNQSVVDGGALFADSTYYYRAFTVSDTLSITGAPLIADMLMVAGGGGGASYGAGGAGGLLELEKKLLNTGTFNVVVGAGGAFGGYYNSAQNGSNTELILGSNTIYKVYGGGAGGYGYGVNGSNGGSGGGGAPGASGGLPIISLQGTNGGAGYVNYGAMGGGGGGGAGSSGSNGGHFTGGHGGSGKTSALISSFGSSTDTGEIVAGEYFYAGGGGGGGNNLSGNYEGGVGGGGDGAGHIGSYGASPGMPNTGGGGGAGGGSHYAGNPQWGQYGQTGGSGVFIIRYLKSSVVPTPVILGGTYSSDATYNYRTFTASDTLVVENGTVNAEVLMIAGGGGGGGGPYPGGGGAGGLLHNASYPIAIGSYPISIGSGGNGISGGTYPANNGSNTIFDSLIAIGGGGGGTTTSGYYNSANGADGGSGGGAAGWSSYSPRLGGLGTLGQGFDGGNGTSGIPAPGAGGGGSAEAGNSHGYSIGGYGTDQYSGWLQEINVGENVSGVWYIAAGGGGGNYYSPVGDTGGIGGGGSGTQSVPGESGQVNTGSGGGGSGYGGNGGNGASGLVTFRWPK